ASPARSRFREAVAGGSSAPLGTVPPTSAATSRDRGRRRWSVSGNGCRTQTRWADRANASAGPPSTAPAAGCRRRRPERRASQRSEHAYFIIARVGTAKAANKEIRSVAVARFWKRQSLPAAALVRVNAAPVATAGAAMHRLAGPVADELAHATVV